MKLTETQQRPPDELELEMLGVAEAKRVVELGAEA